MLEFALAFLFVFLVILFVLLVRAHSGMMRLLFISLISSVITAEIALYAAYSGQSMFLDVALAFALLGFMDVQFYAVYLRRKGDL